jgi:hypothetical protein
VDTGLRFSEKTPYEGVGHPIVVQYFEIPYTKYMIARYLDRLLWYVLVDYCDVNKEDRHRRKNSHVDVEVMASRHWDVHPVNPYSDQADHISSISG